MTPRSWARPAGAVDAFPFAVAAVAVTGTSAALRRRPPGGGERWDRVNHRGAPVTLLAGPAVAAGATLGALTGTRPARLAAAALLAGTAAGAAGVLDDLAGSGGSRGFRGHLAALRRGQPTTGTVKVVGIGAAGVAAAALAGPARPLDAVLGGGVVAGTANLVNLLDLRPGRALKTVTAAGLALGLRPAPGSSVAAAAAGAAVAGLPDDLAERVMVGDGGANALGALVGIALAARTGRRGRAAVLAALVALTAASEVVSYSRVIDATPPLRWLDRLGRQA